MSAALTIGQLTIGQLAKASEVPTKTIRYYEEIALIPDARRAENGYRVYGEDSVATLRFVARARNLGFSIAEVRVLLDLWHDPERASADVRAIAMQHIVTVDRKIDELRALRETLSHLVERCHGDENPECPILGELAEGSECAHEHR